MAKPGIFSWFSYPLPIQERLQKIRQAGFEATSLWWDGNDKDDQPDIARGLGLSIDNIHTPFMNANSFWLDGLDGEGYFNTLMDCVRDCKTHSIPTAVIHTTCFSASPEITTLGMERVKKLVDLAEKQGVNLAFENLKYLEHLDCIFKSFDSPRLGFCYDSGHEHCNHPDADCLARYGQRLFAVHLDDNFGDSDTHLLPYDGTVNWDKVKKELNNCRKIDYMTLEVDFNPKHEKSKIYQNLSADEFLARAYEKLMRFMAE